jgi:hypothetical protein
VPNQRAAGQKLLPIAMKEEFISELDSKIPDAGYANRSQFIRDAIIEKLQRAGINLPKNLAQPPQRTAVSQSKPAPGRLKSVKHSRPKSASPALVEKVSSKPPSDEQELARRAAGGKGGHRSP